MSPIIVKSDLTDLNAAISAAEALNADDYVDFSAVASAINAAKDLTAATAQTDIDAATKALTDAIAALQKKPVETEPEATEPEVTEPEATEPEATEPEATEPEATEPEETEPEATEPEETEPEATEPVESETTVETEETEQATESEAVGDEEQYEEGGCSSVISGAAIGLAIVLTLGTGMIFKKKED